MSTKATERRLAEELVREGSTESVGGDASEWRRDLAKWLHSTVVEKVMITLLVVDVLCVVAEIGIEVHTLNVELEHFEEKYEQCAHTSEHHDDHDDHDDHGRRLSGGGGSSVKGGLAPHACV